MLQAERNDPRIADDHSDIGSGAGRDIAGAVAEDPTEQQIDIPGTNGAEAGILIQNFKGYRIISLAVYSRILPGRRHGARRIGGEFLGSGHHRHIHRFLQIQPIDVQHAHIDHQRRHSDQGGDRRRKQYGRLSFVVPYFHYSDLAVVDAEMTYGFAGINMEINGVKKV